MRLKVGDDFLDQYEDTIIAQNFAVNGLGDIATRQGGFSNTFEIPLTNFNSDILAFPGDMNSSSRNPWSKVDADLYDSGSIVASGYLKYTKVGGNKFKCAFFTNNTEWFQLIKDKSLIDLDMSAYDHLWSAAVQEAAITGDGADGYNYPLIEYGEFNTATPLDVDSTSLFPAIYIWAIFKQIFFDIGWKVEGSMIDHPMYNMMVIPFSAENFVHSNAFIDARRSSTDLVTIPSVMPQSTTDLPIIKADGAYHVIVNLDMEITIGVSFTMTVSFQKNAVQWDSTIVTMTAGVVNQYFLTSANVGLVTADAVTLEFTGGAGQTIRVINTSLMSLEAPYEITQTGDAIGVANILPDISQEDFVQHIFYTFAAIPQANNFSKTLSVGMFNDIKNNIPNALDWSDKIDNSKESDFSFTELLSNYGSKSLILYAEDSDDPILSQYKSETNERFGQGQLDIDNEHIAREETIYESVFSPIVNVSAFNNTMYIPRISFLEFEDGAFERTIKPVPKICLISKKIDVGQLSGSAATVLDIDSGSETMSDIPFAWMVKTKYTDEVDAYLDSLSFGESRFPNVIGDTIRDRFLKGYQDALSDLRYLKEWLVLNEVDIIKLDFLIPVYLQKYDAYFFLNKVTNFRGSDRSTEVELVKIA